MGKIYDDWERLVSRVVRREQEKRMALMTSSTSSRVSSSSYNSSSLIHEESRVHGWSDASSVSSVDSAKAAEEESYVETWLNDLSITPEEKSVNVNFNDSLVYEPGHELHLPGGMIQATEDNQIFFLEETTRKKCLLVGAHELKIKWEGTPKTIRWVPLQDSRFSEAAQLVDVWNLDVKCKIDTHTLSQETLYGAYLVFKLGNPIFGLESVGGVVRFKDRESGSDSAQKAFLLHLHQGYPVDRLLQRQTGLQTGRYPVRRDDGWMEIELGDFYNGNGDNGKVEARLVENKRRHKKAGLIIEGVEFRPKTFLSNSIRLCDVKPNYFLDKKSGKKCAVVGARELLIEWGESPRKWIWTRHTDSRFLEVAQLKRVHWLEVRGRMETRMLLPETNYGAYLVIKLANEFYGLQSVKRFVRFVGRESGKDAEERASPVHLDTRTYQPPPLETELFAVTRGDGWMEVELGEFYFNQGDDDEVEARLLDIWTNNEKKSGLIVEAIEFRPK